MGTFCYWPLCPFTHDFQCKTSLCNEVFSPRWIVTFPSKKRGLNSCSATESTVIISYSMKVWAKCQKANCNVSSCQLKPVSTSNSLTQVSPLILLSLHPLFSCLPSRRPDMRIPLLSNVIRISGQWNLSVSSSRKWEGKLESSTSPSLAVTFHQTFADASRPLTGWIFIRWLDGRWGSTVAVSDIWYSHWARKYS